MRHILASLLMCVSSTACVRHIYPINDKTRTYDPGEYAAPDAERTAGSLWSEGSQSLFEDPRAKRVGDIVTVQVVERSDATRDANTKTSRDSSTSMGISSFFSAMKRLVAADPNFDPSALLSATSSDAFEGAGSTSRSGALTATLPVRIKRLLPNGDFYVEGTKVLLLNDEESHLYLSGVVRPIDIQPDNTVFSSRLADVELEYTGRGVVSERQSPGWLARLLDYIRPF